MGHLVRLGVELAVGRGDAFGRVVEVAARVAAEGWGVLWISGWPDPCTLAGALTGSPAPPVIGVVAELPAGRHPAVLARELTGLDVLSGGRAAVLVRWRVAPGGLTPADPARYLDEAVEIYRRVCSEELPTFEGGYLRVAGARNLPGPVGPGGPPMVVEPPTGWDHVPEGADGVVAATGNLVGTRRALDRRGGPRRVALLWRAPSAAGPDDVRAARDAGADGMVVTVEARDPYRALDHLAGAWSG